MDIILRVFSCFKLYNSIYYRELFFSRSSACFYSSRRWTLACYNFYFSSPSSFLNDSALLFCFFKSFSTSFILFLACFSPYNFFLYSSLLTFASFLLSSTSFFKRSYSSKSSYSRSSGYYAAVWSLFKEEISFSVVSISFFMLDKFLCNSSLAVAFCVILSLMTWIFSLILSSSTFYMLLTSRWVTRTFSIVTSIIIIY